MIKKVILVLTYLSLLLISVILTMNFISNLNTENTQNNGSVQNNASDESLQDILDKNNEELLALVDTRKTVVFAIYGIDDKTTEDGRSDIIMVLKYDPESKKMIIASIPRDTRVDIPGYGMNKINAAYAYGGEKLIDQVVEDLLGIKLDFSIKLNFDTFSNIIDSLGGVHVNAKKQFFDSTNTLVIDQGNQLLSGMQALFYVRFRKDSDNDYGRVARQQEVVVSLFEHLKTMSIQEKIKLITKYYNKGIQTDANLSKLTDYISMSSGDQEVIYENYRLQTYGELIDGLWYELYRQEDLDFIKNLFSDKSEMNLENWK